MARDRKEMINHRKFETSDKLYAVVKTATHKMTCQLHFTEIKDIQSTL